MPYKACGLIWKVLISAVANAEHNLNLNKKSLIVSEAYANQGPILRRMQPRAQGRAYAIRKPTCHIYIVVKENIQNQTKT